MSGRVTGPAAGHLVTVGELAYAAMGNGNLLVPVKVERIAPDDDDDDADQEHLRVTVKVTADRHPWRRGERMYDLPADHIVSRKATGIRAKFGGRIVLRSTVVLPPKDATWKASR